MLFGIHQIIILLLVKNYIKKLKIKNKYIKENIKYLKTQIADSEISESTKENLYLPALKRAEKSLIAFEKKAAIISA